MDGYRSYRENAVLTQSPERLVVLLYEGAIRNLRQAVEAMAEGRHEDKATHINKAVAVIDELNVSLDMEVGGEVATNLRKLYLFMNGHLNEAVVRDDPQMVRDVIACLEDLHAGWAAVAG